MGDVVMDGEAPGGSRVLRRRRRDTPERRDDGLATLMDVASSARKIVVFSGSGLSASSGMSMFSTTHGLYAKAKKRFQLAKGKDLFTWSHFVKRRADFTSFFVDIHKEARKAKPGPAHKAVAELHDCGALLRHYTMNVDGLATHSGMSVWHHEHNNDGMVVELHGNVHYLVCPKCEHVAEARPGDLNILKRCLPRICPACQSSELRFKIMLYDDKQSDTITPEKVYERLETDLEEADLIVWVGISFEQSASLEYFRTARSFIKAADREHLVRQALVNPCGEAWFNMYSNMGNAGALNAFPVRTGADIAMEAVAAATQQDHARMADLLQQSHAAAAISGDRVSGGEEGAPMATRATGTAAACTQSVGDGARRTVRRRTLKRPLQQL
eukprot:jgi/Ulvmu1/8770/UM048_0025.1